MINKANMYGPVFLSASVPTKEQKGFDTADPYLIRIAVSSFIEVVLGRRLIVWGGHPTITPMITEKASEFKVNYLESVRLFQSKIFRDQYPKENNSVRNVTYVDSVNNDTKLSLRKLRERMFSSYKFSAAVFIGGMEGVIDEFELFHEYNRYAVRIPIPSPGGVSRELFEKILNETYNIDIKLMKYEINFSWWLHKLLDISPLQERALKW